MPAQIPEYIQIVGIICGMITIGYLCDRIGRKWGSVTTVSLMCVGAILMTVQNGTSDQDQVIVCESCLPSRCHIWNSCPSHSQWYCAMCTAFLACLVASCRACRSMSCQTCDAVTLPRCRHHHAVRVRLRRGRRVSHGGRLCGRARRDGRQARRPLPRPRRRAQLLHAGVCAVHQFDIKTCRGRSCVTCSQASASMSPARCAHQLL